MMRREHPESTICAICARTILFAKGPTISRTVVEFGQKDLSRLQILVVTRFRRSVGRTPVATGVSDRSLTRPHRSEAEPVPSFLLHELSRLAASLLGLKPLLLQRNPKDDN